MCLPQQHHTYSINNNTVTLHQPIKQTYNISLHCAQNMHDQPPHPVSRILKHVGSTVRQADVQRYDSECSFGELSVELWGRCVLVAPTVQSPRYLSSGVGENWVTRLNTRGKRPMTNINCVCSCYMEKLLDHVTLDHHLNHI